MKIGDIKINDNYLCFVLRTKLNKDVNKCFGKGKSLEEMLAEL